MYEAVFNPIQDEDQKGPQPVFSCNFYKRKT